MQWLEGKMAAMKFAPYKNKEGKFTIVDEKTYTASSKSATNLHFLWDGIVQRNVHPGKVDGLSCALFDYDKVATDPQENKIFNSYINLIATVDPVLLNPNELLALYMNAYNAFTVKTIITHMKKKNVRAKSIKSITSLGSKFKPIWNHDAGILCGQKVSLDDVEHKLLRAMFAEPHLHACIVCASASCPNLRNEAFDASKLKTQMQEQFQSWVDHPLKGDFQPTPVDYLKKHGSIATKNALNRATSKVSYFDYSWEMNDWSRREE